MISLVHSLSICSRRLGLTLAQALTQPPSSLSAGGLGSFFKEIQASKENVYRLPLLHFQIYPVLSPNSPCALLSLWMNGYCLYPEQTSVFALDLISLRPLKDITLVIASLSSLSLLPSPDLDYFLSVQPAVISPLSLLAPTLSLCCRGQ